MTPYLSQERREEIANRWQESPQCPATHQSPGQRVDGGFSCCMHQRGHAGSHMMNGGFAFEKDSGERMPDETEEVVEARADIAALLAESAALRGLLRAALDAVCLDSRPAWQCDHCRGWIAHPKATREGRLRANEEACACPPGASWVRDAIAAGLHDE